MPWQLGKRAPDIQFGDEDPATEEDRLMARKEPAKRVSRVVVVDGDPDMRRHLRGVLQSAQDFDLAGEFSNRHEALAALPRLRPDVVLMDICVFGLNGINCVKRLKTLLACFRLILITGLQDGDSMGAALWTGVDGCLIKPVSAEQCLATLRSVGKSQTTVSPKYEPSERQRCDAALPQKHLLLTSRQVQVMEKLANGRLDKEIAAELGISETVVHKQVHKIYLKFHVHNRVEAVSVWLNGNAIGSD